VDNALDYANNHSLIKGAKAEKTDVFIVFNEDRICVKFNYNEDIINEIRKIDKSERTYNPKHKYWIIAESQIKPLMRSLRDMANFKMIGQDLCLAQCINNFTNLLTRDRMYDIIILIKQKEDDIA